MRIYHAVLYSFESEITQVGEEIMQLHKIMLIDEWAIHQSFNVNVIGIAFPLDILIFLFFSKPSVSFAAAFIKACVTIGEKIIGKEGP